MHKNYKTNSIIVTAILLLYILIPAFLFLFAKLSFIKFFAINYFFLFFSVFLMISPYGKIRLGEQLHYSTTRWIMMIVALDIILYLLFFSFTHTVTHYIPYQEILGNAVSMKFILQELATQWGMYPWALYAVLAVSMGYMHYCKKRLPLYSSLLPVLKDSYLDTFTKRLVQILLIVNTTFIVCMTVGLFGVQIALVFSKIFQLTPVYELGFVTLILGIIFLFLLHTPAFERGIQFLSRKKISVGIFFLSTALLLAVFFILLNNIAPTLQFYLLNNNVKTFEFQSISASLSIWQIAIACWWLGFAMLVATAIMRISYGRSIREIIFAVMLFPIIVTVCGIKFSTVEINHPILLDVLALIGPLCLIILFFRSHTAKLFSSGFASFTENYFLAKPRPTIKFIIPVLRGIAFLGVMYMWMGLTMTSVTLALATFSCLFIFIGFSLLFYCELFADGYSK